MTLKTHLFCKEVPVPKNLKKQQNFLEISEGTTENLVKKDEKGEIQDNDMLALKKAKIQWGRIQK